jgi:hypothetical protein
MKGNTDPGLELVDVRIADEKEMNGYEQTSEAKGTRENETKRDMKGAMEYFRPAKNFSFRGYNFLRREKSRRYLCVLKLREKL